MKPELKFIKAVPYQIITTPVQILMLSKELENVEVLKLFCIKLEEKLPFLPRCERHEEHLIYIIVLNENTILDTKESCRC